jgi:hypothetical protein
MSKEKGEELFRALNVILDAVSSLNLRDSEAEAKADRGESSSKAAAESSKGKDKVAEPDWEDIPVNPVSIIPLSSRPRFTQVVGIFFGGNGSSSCWCDRYAPSWWWRRWTWSWRGWSPWWWSPWWCPRGGGPPGSPRRSPSQSPSLGRSPSPSGSGNDGDGDGDGDGVGGGGGGLGAGDAQPGGGAQQQPLAYKTAAQFLGMWNNCATDVARQNLEQQAITRSPVAEVQLAAMVKINLRLQTTVGALTGQVGAAQAAAAAANQAAVNAQAVATAAGNADRFRPAAPLKYGNKKKDAEVKQWILIIEDYLRTAPDGDYIRLASSYLEGGPRSLWTSVYEAYKPANGGAEPPQPRVFFRETLENNYGLQDLEQKYWDTWNSLRQGPTQDIAEYSVEFRQALTDLAGSVTDEQVKIEKYRSGLQHDLRELCRTSPTGARWAHLTDLVQYATL